METNTNCMDNMSNIDGCHENYYVCTYNCFMSVVIMSFGFMWCCVLGCYYSFKRRRPVYANLYTQELGDEYIHYDENDRGLIIRGRGINTSPPKYSEH